MFSVLLLTGNVFVRVCNLIKNLHILMTRHTIFVFKKGVKNTTMTVFESGNF